MVDDRVESLDKTVSGSIKEAIGKITGDSVTQAEGRAEKVSGTAPNGGRAVNNAAPNLDKGQA